MAKRMGIQGWFWAIVVVGFGLYAAINHGNKDAGSTFRPSGNPVDQLQIMDQSQKDAGTADGSFYNYVTVRNTSTALIQYVGVNSTCRNDAGTVVGTAYGNEANVAPGEQAVVTVLFLNVDDCTHISSTFDSLTG